ELCEMKDCLSCEITNASKRAARMYNMGMTVSAIALHLSDVYRENYYEKDARLYRSSKQHPFIPFLILDVN
ncbi:MAG: hypothetical protein ACRDBM_13325, partial [Sporomusa sp.]